MDRTRILFIAIIALALFVVLGLFGMQALQEDDPVVTVDQTRVVTTDVVTQKPTNVPSESGQLLDSPDPVFAPSADLSDGLPQYICGADTFGSYFTLQQMQMSGVDVANGFHLGIIPFNLDDLEEYDVTEEQRTALLQNGQWNCLLTTLDSVALKSPGVITAIIDETAGADQLWGRDVENLNALDGKRIAFARGSVGEYFVYYALSIARLNPRFDVTLLPQDSVADAVQLFNDGKADAVSAWVPDVLDAEEYGGTPLLSSNQLRIVIDTIVTSRQSITNDPDLVQNFHNAWFATLKAQTEDFDTAAKQIADWGHNDWTFVYPESASADLADEWLSTIAQADLSDNIAVMRDTRALVDRLNIARRVWAAAGLDVPQDNVEELINPNFVQLASQQASLQSTGNPVNDTFSIAAKIDLTGVSDSADAATLAVLPCREFQFLPESTELTYSARTQLDDCVVPTMKQSVGLLLEIKGSSAWPENTPPFTEEEIYEFAYERAESVRDYLVSQGIDPARFIVTATVPPVERQNTPDGFLQEKDRFVEMKLITSGR